MSSLFRNTLYRWTANTMLNTVSLSINSFIYFCINIFVTLTIDHAEPMLFCRRVTVIICCQLLLVIVLFVPISNEYMSTYQILLTVCCTNTVLFFMIALKNHDTASFFFFLQYIVNCNFLQALFIWKTQYHMWCTHMTINYKN